jgi:hypothetical protein
MSLSSSTKRAIQYKSSAKKLAHLCTELGDVNSYKLVSSSNASDNASELARDRYELRNLKTLKSYYPNKWRFSSSKYKSGYIPVNDVHLITALWA